MDYYQGVVTEYLRADRAMFVNPECAIQLEEGPKPAKGRHWYCDVMAVSFRESTVYLCEVTYSSTMQSLLKRLQAWEDYWPEICEAIQRDCKVPASWLIRPWVFIPKKRKDAFNKKFSSVVKANRDANHMPEPKVKDLESVAPWNFPFDRKTSASETDAEPFDR